MLKVGAEQFQAADALLMEGKTAKTVEALTKLRDEYSCSWIDRVAGERIEGKHYEKKTANMVLRWH